MSKQLFVIVLVALLLGLVGWIYYVSAQQAQVEPVQQIGSKWGDSPHADRAAEAFNHWNEDEPPVVPPYCAQCHSAYGYLDFLGEDGTAAGVVDNPAPVGSVISCQVCHNDAAHSLNEAGFTSGEVIGGLGMEANCMECHQGRVSNVEVRKAIAEIPADAVSEDLAFMNVHYKIAASTLTGADTQTGYQYDGKTYAATFQHADGARRCLDCHDPHSLRVAADNCAVCHSNVVNYGDFKDIRVSKVDYDGDGDSTEGIHYEIETLREILYGAIQDYAADSVGAPLFYNESFPYVFADTNANGLGDPDELKGSNSYQSWTPRLVRTTFNYHFSRQDGGNYVHNADYVLQLLYDSIADLAEVVPVDMTGLVRP